MNKAKPPINQVKVVQITGTLGIVCDKSIECVRTTRKRRKTDSQKIANVKKTRFKGERDGLFFLAFVQRFLSTMEAA